MIDERSHEARRTGVPVGGSIAPLARGLNATRATLAKAALLVAFVALAAAGAGCSGSGAGGASAPAGAGSATSGVAGTADSSAPLSASPSTAPSVWSSPSGTASASHAVWPSAAALATTERWLRARLGVTALAVVDSRGQIHGYGYDVQYPSASVVKAMLLVQYLRTHAGIPARERFLLARMIVGSDNAATDRVFAQVETGGLVALARAAGMKRFTPSAVWALSLVTAADQARFFLHVDRLVPGQHRALLDLLLSERGRYRGWGIPQVALERGWRVWWKDGWIHSARGELLLQAARLERRGVTFAVAVIADGQPTSGYGVATMRGVGARLLP